MASKIDISLPIQPEPEIETPEEVDGFVNLSSRVFSRERAGARSYTVVSELVEVPDDPSCLMRKKSRGNTTLPELESRGEDLMGLEWERVDYVMIAVHEYSTDGKKENAVRKDDVIFVTASSKCGTWCRGLNSSTGAITTIPSKFLKKRSDTNDQDIGQNRGAILLDKGPQWDSSASNSVGTPSLTSDDARFLSDLHSNTKQIMTQPIIDNSFTEDFSSVARFQIFNVAGVDKEMRPVITFAACRLPSVSSIDHNILLRYMMHTLEQYVENDYTVVYFHTGLNSTNKPSVRWLWTVYRELDRKYKKNLKRLYIVHPTNFIKLIFTFFKPYISAKFGKKLQYINRLEELENSLYLHQIDIPQEVKRHNDTLKYRKTSRSLTEGAKPAYYANNGLNSSGYKELGPDSQFGVSLNVLVERQKQIIPYIIEDCVTYIENEGLQSVGLFRRGPGQGIVQEIKSKANKGERIQFQEIGDVHLAAVLIKMFLRELPQPLLTEELYYPVKKIHELEDKMKIAKTKHLIGTLPPINIALLKHILYLLKKVVINEETNRMSASNLSIVIGPNILWSSKESASLNTLNYINAFTYLLITRVDDVFPEETTV